MHPRKGQPPADAFGNPHLSRLLAACAYAYDFEFEPDEPLQELARRLKAKRPSAWKAYVKKYEWTKEERRDVYGIRD